LELGLLGFCLDFLLAGLLAFLFSPAAAGNQPTSKSLSAVAMTSRRARAARTAPRSAIQSQWAANEFAFGRAIEAYEELIDTTVGKAK
jgi:hypothetical protein